MGNRSSETVILRPVCFSLLCPQQACREGHTWHSSLRAAYTDGAAGLVIEVAKRQAFLLRTDHLICLGFMGEEFGTIDASSFCFGSLQATLPEAPEEFNVSCMHGDHTLMVGETSIRNHLGC